MAVTPTRTNDTRTASTVRVQQGDGGRNHFIREEVPKMDGNTFKAPVDQEDFTFEPKRTGERMEEQAATHEEGSKEDAGPEGQDYHHLPDTIRNHLAL